ncbi:MAG: hypothetical protein MI725_16130 [Pirellulales bacterium]|nr:hypothetical protein [Pirellulales bacterium]
METAPVLLERIFEPVGDVLTPTAAKRIVAWEIDDDTQHRIDYLADKSNNGTLTTDEAAEYDRYLSAFDIVAVLQAQARAILKDAGQS